MSHFANMMTTTNKSENVPEDMCASDEDNSRDDFEDDSINNSEDNSENDSEGNENNSSDDSGNDNSPTTLFSSFSR